MYLVMSEHPLYKGCLVRAPPLSVTGDQKPICLGLCASVAHASVHTLVGNRAMPPAALPSVGWSRHRNDGTRASDAPSPAHGPDLAGATSGRCRGPSASGYYDQLSLTLHNNARRLPPSQTVKADRPHATLQQSQTGPALARDANDIQPNSGQPRSTSHPTSTRRCGRSIKLFVCARNAVPQSLCVV